MKIWLDDIRTPPDETWIWCTDYDSAYERIDASLYSHDKLTEISFDHDLGDDALGNGCDIACFIEELAYHNEIDPIVWHVHSANPPGRENIIRAMQSAERYWNRRP